jgi:hypothetical protein
VPHLHHPTRSPAHQRSPRQGTCSQHSVTLSHTNKQHALGKAWQKRLVLCSGECPNTSTQTCHARTGGDVTKLKVLCFCFTAAAQDWAVLLLYVKMLLLPLLLLLLPLPPLLLLLLLRVPHLPPSRPCRSTR